MRIDLELIQFLEDELKDERELHAVTKVRLEAAHQRCDKLASLVKTWSELAEQRRLELDLHVCERRRHRS